MVAKPDARIIFLTQTRIGCCELTRQAAQQRARGCVVNTGDQLSAYQVGTTVPDGPVLVTETTQFVYAN